MDSNEVCNSLDLPTTDIQRGTVYFSIDKKTNHKPKKTSLF